jgi:hypothetical protein
MKKMAILLVPMLCSQTYGGIIYDDGGTHTVNGASADITVSNATTLNVQTGAQISGVNGTSTTRPTHAVDAEGAGTVVTVSGGSLVGGNNDKDESTAAFSALRVGPGVAAILTGGTFQGGVDFRSQNSNFAVDAFSGSVTIQGGLFHAVSGVNPGGSLGFFSDLYTSSSSLSITGGTFDGQVSVFLSGATSSATFAGGTFLNTNLFLSGTGSSSVTISGGQFLAPSIILSLSDGATVSFSGSGLQFVGNGRFGGRLFGTLADGHVINEVITIAGLDGDEVSVSPNLIVFAAPIPTPAPASAIMMSLGMAPVAWIVWRRRRVA